MAITRDKKEELLDKARGIFADSSTAVFVHAKGLSAGDTNAMRSDLVKSDVGYAVIKKTLINNSLCVGYT